MAEPFPLGQRVRVTTRDAEEFDYPRGSLGTVETLLEPSPERMIPCYIVAMDLGGTCTFHHLELMAVQEEVARG